MKTNVFFKVLLVFGFLGILSGCGYSYGNGHIVSEERSVTAFDYIEFDGVGEVYIHSSDNYKVIVTADSNVQDSIIIKVNGTHLSIDEKERVYTRDLTIDVYLPEMESLSIAHSGVGDVDARNYKTENMCIKISGVGDTKIWATKSLTGKISGIGDVYYKGEPVIDVNRSGIGALKKL